MEAPAAVVEDQAAVMEEGITEDPAAAKEDPAPAAAPAPEAYGAASDSGAAQLMGDDGAPQAAAATGCAGALCSALCAGLCVFWIPLLFFMGAANTLGTCESDTFTVWLRVYGILPLSLGVLSLIIVTVLVSKCSAERHKVTLRLQGVTGLVSLGIIIWGWVEYSKTTEVACVGDGDIDPRKLALAFLIIASIPLGLSICICGMGLMGCSAGAIHKIAPRH